VAFQLPHRSDGGLESATRIFEALSDDYEWSFVTTRETEFTDRWRTGGARVILSPFSENLSRPMQMLNYARWASRIFAAAVSTRADCIHANDIRAYNAASLPVHLLRLPLLLTVRGTKATGGPYGRHWRRAARQCHRIDTLSDEMARIIADATGGPQEKIRTINSIVDLAEFTPPSAEERAAARHSLGIGQREFAIGGIGAIRDIKNQLELIEKTLPTLFTTNSSARLHLFGDYRPGVDPYAKRCTESVQRLGMQQRVVFHGHTNDIAQRLKALDAIVISAREEGLARAMIEGMACGIPVVSFSVCSAAEMLGDSGAGVVVSKGDYKGLIDALARLASDPDLRFQMGRRGRAFAEQRFGMEKIRTEYRKLYDEIHEPHVASTGRVYLP
jgi:glycosyltransferase involved in cell wall biosynthesis